MGQVLGDSSTLYTPLGKPHVDIFNVVCCVGRQDFTQPHQSMGLVEFHPAPNKLTYSPLQTVREWVMTIIYNYRTTPTAANIIYYPTWRERETHTPQTYANACNWRPLGCHCGLQHRSVRPYAPHVSITHVVCVCGDMASAGNDIIIQLNRCGSCRFDCFYLRKTQVLLRDKWNQPSSSS